MTKIGRFLFLTMILILGGIGANVFGQNLIGVFDGQDRFPDSQKPTDKDRELFDNVIKNQEANIKADLKKHLPDDCEILIRLETVLEGSFTKLKSFQKAYVYYGSCKELKVFEKNANAIIITENDKVVFNRFYSTENLQAVKQLPDINKNGLSELVIISADDFDVLDSSETWLDIVECKSGDTFNYLGKATTRWWYGLSAKKDDEGIPGYIPTSYKIYVKPSTSPIFYRETYRDIRDEKTKETKWVLTKKLEEFALIKEMKID